MVEWPSEQSLQQMSERLRGKCERCGAPLPERAGRRLFTPAAVSRYERAMQRAESDPARCCLGSV